MESTAATHVPAKASSPMVSVTEQWKDLKNFWMEKGLSQSFTKTFYWGLAFKLAIIILTIPPMMDRLFVPFTNWFVTNQFANPYEHFYQAGPSDIFPYSSIMLWLYSLPSAIVATFTNFGVDVTSPAAFIWPRLTIVAADVMIYLVLCSFLPVQKKRVGVYWWLNPVVIYASYIHGQLDLLPTAALLVSLVLLFSRRDVLAFIALGIGIAMKSHIVAALPFFCLYIGFRSFNWIHAILLCLLSTFLFALLQYPYWSEAYIHLVLLEKKSHNLFQLSFPFDANGKAFLFAPAIVMFIFFRYLFFSSSNKDTLLLTLGLVYAAMVGVVPPSPGWFIWCMPFLVYFFVKFREAPRSLLTAFLVSYVLYHLVEAQSDIPRSFAVFWPSLAHSANLSEWIQSRGFNPKIVENLGFTGMEGALILNILWMYKLGMSSSNLSRLRKQNFRVGICGDSGSGKSTLTQSLLSMFGQNNTLVIAGDDLHKWERGDANWQKQTHLNPKANRLSVDVEHAQRLMEGRSIKRSFYDHKTGKFTKHHALESKAFILFQGLHTFMLPKMRNLLHFKIFTDPDRALRQFWKVRRDMAKRGYSKEQVLAQLEQREPDSQKFIETQKIHADLIIRYKLIDESVDLESLLKQNGEPPIKIQMEFDADLDAESLQDCLKRVSEVKTDYWYEPVESKIIFECYGDISAAQIGAAAELMTSLYQEILDGTPKWSSGFDGIIQLVVLLYLKQFYIKGYQDHE
jgi:uridine kinase